MIKFLILFSLTVFSANAFAISPNNCYGIKETENAFSGYICTKQLETRMVFVKFNQLADGLIKIKTCYQDDSLQIIDWYGKQSIASKGKRGIHNFALFEKLSAEGQPESGLLGYWGMADGTRYEALNAEANVELFQILARELEEPRTRCYGLNNW